MANEAEKLQGLFLPVTTPFQEDMSVDYGALKANMAFYAQSGVKGYLALGSNGENRCLREEEKKRALQCIMENKADYQIVMTGCIYDSTPQTVEFMRFVKEMGCDFATLLTPSYFKKQMTHQTLVDYFAECAESVDIPVLLYNAPGFSGVTIEVETAKTLGAHPNIWGMKDSAPSGIENFIQLQSESFHVMAGSAGFIYSSMIQGCQGGVASLANAAPDCGLKLIEHGLAGDTAEGHSYQQLMRDANKKISGSYGVPGVKAAMDIMGLAGMHPRKPLKRLGDAERATIKSTLKEAGILS